MPATTDAQSELTSVLYSMRSRVMKVQTWHDGPRVGENMDYSTILRHLPLETGDLRSSNTVVQFYRDWLAHPEYANHDCRIAVLALT